MSQNLAMLISDSGRADWTRCWPTKDEENGDPSFYSPRELSIYTIVLKSPSSEFSESSTLTPQLSKQQQKKEGKCRNLVSGKIATLSITAIPLIIIPTPLTIIPTLSIPSIIPSIILPRLTRGIKFSHGYLHWNPEYGTMILEPTESNMWETGS